MAAVYPIADFFFLMCCILFCTLLCCTTKSRRNTDESYINEHSNDDNDMNHIDYFKKNISGQINDIEPNRENNDKPKIHRKSGNNLGVFSQSDGQSSTIKDNICNKVISPRTQSAIMSICTANSVVTSDWETELTVEDIDIAFDYIMPMTNGEQASDDEYNIYVTRNHIPI
eukprot:425397_1